jgi:putative tryptophan/tyrosine transport system substrate-binding protein
MKRRQFITLLGSAAAAWPLAARAQQPAMPVIGILEDSGPKVVVAFRKGLSEGGLIEGSNVAIEHASTEQYAELPALADSLVRRRVAVIAALGGVPAKNAKAATATIPIVFSVGGDPVELGLVTSFNRPGGNLTGVTFFAAQLLQKQVGTLHDLVPKATTIGVLVNPNNPRHQADIDDVQSAGAMLNLEVEVAKAGSEHELDAAFVRFLQRNARALIIAGDAFFLFRREQIVALAARHAIPAMYNTRDFAIAGGLMSYGASLTDAARQAGIYAARIVKGEKPGDLPVMQPTKFELTINLKTAKALGLTVPDKLLVAADEVIE